MAPWHHVFLRTVVALAALAAFLSVGFLGVYRYVDGYWLYRGFPRPHDPAFVHLFGRAVRIEVASAALGGRRQPVDVYLPPGYGSHPRERYPVLYHRARPLILVMPFGSTGSFVDKEWANGVGLHEGWESFVAHDLVRAVDARFRTIRSNRARGIGGLSEGGYGAINIAIHHPGEFGLVESWSGYEKADDLGSIFGHRRSLLARNTPLDTLGPAAPALRRADTFFWLYSGRDDRFFGQNEVFVSELERHGIAHRFRIVHGGHNWALWRGNAADAYLAASKHLGGVSGT